MTRALSALMICVLACPLAGAQVGVVFEQASRTTQGDTTNGYYSSVLWDELLYDDASLAQTSNISAIQLWGYNFEYEPEIRVSIYEDSAGEIGAVLDSRVFPAGAFTLEPTGGMVVAQHWLADEYLASFEFTPPVRMDAGVSYWVSVTGQTELGWSYEALGGNQRIFYSNALGTSFWDQNDTDMAFRLLGAEASPADLGEPFGVLDFTDVVLFLNAFASQSGQADLAPPAGVVDFSDVVAFLSAFGQG